MKSLLRVLKHALFEQVASVSRKIQLYDHTVRSDQQVRMVKNLSMGCTSVLDVGCGPCSLIAKIKPWAYSVGVEGDSSRAAAADDNHTHSEIIVGDVNKLPELFGKDSFDLVVAMDLIEHLPKADGKELIKNMERIARKRLLITTPNGFLPQFNQQYSLEEHVSGWTNREMEDLGFTVRGLFGPKAFRGEYHLIKWRPVVVLIVISALYHKLIGQRFPAFSAGICCVRIAPH